MHVRVLGSGTSTGVPEYKCECPICQDARIPGSHNRRTRSSIYLRTDESHLVVDCGPNFLDQIDRHKVEWVDAILFTHSHADHISGINDLVAPCRKQKCEMPIYGPEETIEVIRRNFDYMFDRSAYQGGGIAHLIPNVVDSDFFWKDIHITPIPVEHGAVKTLGYRLNRLGYLPDVKILPPTSLELLRGVEVLIIDGLSFNSSHPTHISVGDAVAISNTLKPRQTYLTHISHRIDQKRFEVQCAENGIALPGNLWPAYDGLKIDF